MTTLGEDDIRALVDAGDDPARLLQAVADIAAARLGAKLVSAMRFDAETMTVHRIFSSDPVSYPPGGSKPKRDTAWGRHVLTEGRHFTAEGAAEIRAAFPDAETILRLGLTALVNVPLRLGGATRGTLNILVDRPTWEPEEVEFARLLGLLAARAVA